MFDQLFNILESLAERISPFAIVDQTEEGILLRFGIFKRVLKPGLHWVIPFIDEVRTDTIVPNVINLGSQSLITKDKKQVTVSAVVTYRITNIEKAFLKIQDLEDAIGDVCQGALGTEIAAHYFDDLNTPEFTKEVKAKCQKKTIKFGATIDSFALDNLSRAILIRHYGINE